MCNDKLDSLAKKLFKRISEANTDIFNTPLVIVPSKSMTAFLKAYFLKMNNNGDVLMNIDFKTLNQVILNGYDDNYALADNCYIKSLIIKYLNENNIKELEDYFSDSKTKGINIYDVSEKLTSAFNFYDENLVDINSLDKSGAYQKDIYNYVKKTLESNHMTTLAMLNKENNIKKIDAFIFGFNKYTKLEEEIINKYINIIEKFDMICNNVDIDINKITKLIKAPNKTREIEALHSDICKKINEDNKLNFSDFLVVSNNLSEYSVAINRVFNQDNNGYPAIPFYISDSSDIINETNNLLNLLFKIGKKNYFTRQELSNILDSWITKKINNLTEEDTDVIKKSIVDLNVYRKKEDWEYFVKRLEISKICDINDEDDSVILSSGEYIPFSQIGLDNNNMNSIINIINNLYSFIDIFKNTNCNLDLIEKIKNELKKWLSVVEFGIEKNSYYHKMDIMLDFWKKNEIEAQLDTLFYNLIDLTNQSKSNKGSLYTSGVSFTSFDVNCVISAKYVYFIGASSENLPLVKEKNPFDFSNIEINYNDEKNAFKLYCLNAEKLYFSYVNKNLKENQEQYFLSTFVKKLYKNVDIPYYEMPLDETRDYEDITTKRGMDNKDYNDKLVNKSNNTNSNTNANQIPSPAPIDKITSGKMGEFLNEPLSFRANQLFGRNDELDSDLEEEFEPFTIDKADRSSIFKELLINELINLSKNLMSKLQMENRLPHITSDKSINDYISVKEYTKIEKDVNDYIEFIDSIRENHNYEIICKTKYVNNNTIIVLDDLKLSTFTLTNNYDVLRIKKDDEWIYVPLKVLTKIRGKDILSSYIVALWDVIQSNEDSEEIINISIFQKVYGNKKNKYMMSINKRQANNIINDIFDAINSKYLIYSKFFDSKLLFYDDEFDKVKDSIKDLVSKVSDENGGYWNYFDSKELFDLFNQLGYGNNYKNEIEDMKNKMNGLIIITRLEV